MSSWFAMKQALTVMDLATRGWARELNLDECGVMVLRLLGERPNRAACEMALLCGRARQQVQRSLGDMRRKQLVQPAELSARGRVEAWSLTARGQALWRCLERGIRAWDEELEIRLEVPELIFTLQRIVEILVNRPGADGWRRGLVVPRELTRIPLRLQALVEGAIDVDPLPAQANVPLDAEGRESTPNNNWTDEERRAVARAWNALWS